jgi:hypothetical protein
MVFLGAQWRAAKPTRAKNIVCFTKKQTIFFFDVKYIYIHIYIYIYIYIHTYVYTYIHILRAARGCCGCCCSRHAPRSAAAASAPACVCASLNYRNLAVHCCSCCCYAVAAAIAAENTHLTLLLQLPDAADTHLALWLSWHYEPP